MRKSEYCKNWWFARTALNRELRALDRFHSSGYRARKKQTGFLRRMFQALTNSRGSVDMDLIVMSVLMGGMVTAFLVLSGYEHRAQMECYQATQSAECLK